MKLLSVDRAWSVLRLTDEADSALPLHEQANAHIEASPYMILDVRGILFTSMEIGELINLYHHCETVWNGRQQIALRLANVFPTSAEVLETTKLTDRFPVFDSVEAAMAAPLPHESREADSA